MYVGGSEYLREDRNYKRGDRNYKRGDRFCKIDAWRKDRNI